MMIAEVLKAILLGIVEGITEWLPISSTGHMILVDEVIKLNTSKEFKELFMVVIQLGAILAVLALFWNKIVPFKFQEGEPLVQKNTMVMWGKIIIATIPAAIVGVFFDDPINELFYRYEIVAIALIGYGILFLLIETYNKRRKPKMESIDELSYSAVLLIGFFQLLAAVIPGTSRSGATIIGGILIGASRVTATEFTFYLAIPAMFGASFLKILKFGLHFTGSELMILLIGMVTAYIVSMIVIRFLMGYIKKHDFKVFGWYRIVLGVLVLFLFSQ